MTHNIWVGEQFEVRPERILVLGEYWNEKLGSLYPYVHRWATKQVPDHTFSRVAHTLKRTQVLSTKADTHLEAWQQIAFFNLVTVSGDVNAKVHLTKSQYDAATVVLSDVLRQVKPNGVWILGLRLGEYAGPVVGGASIVFEVSPGPSSRPRNQVYDESLSRLFARVRAQLPSY